MPNTFPSGLRGDEGAAIEPDLRRQDQDKIVRRRSLKVTPQLYICMCQIG